MKKISLLFLLVMSLAYGQGYEQIFEEYDVVLYQLQANVLGKAGKPVKGLKAADFELIVDGRKQVLESISEVDMETMASSLPAVEVKEKARRLFVFFFDMRFTSRTGLVRSQEAALDFVENQMLPGDLVGVFTYMLNRGVVMVNNFTDDRNQLSKSLASLGMRQSEVNPAGGYPIEGVLQDTLQLVGFDDRGLLTNPMGSTLPIYGQDKIHGRDAQMAAAEHVEDMARQTRNVTNKDYQRQVSDYLGSMHAFANGLRFIRGRKNMVLFSEGFDSDSLVGASSKELDKNAYSAMWSEYHEVDTDQLGSGAIQAGATRLMEAFQQSGTVIFAIDTGQNSADNKRKDRVQALNMFARDTGGRLFTNRNGLTEKSLDEVKNITNHYYVLGFKPQWKSTSREESAPLKLKVKGRHKVYTSKALLKAANFKDMSPIEKNIHLAEYMARDQVIRGLPVSVDTLRVPTAGSLVKTSVSTTISGDYFFTKKHARHLEVFTMAIDRESGKVYDQSYFQFKVDPVRMGDELTGNGLKYFANLFVLPGSYTLKVVVRDLENGKVGSALEPLEVGPVETMELTGPLFVDKDRWVLVKQPESLERKSRPDQLDFSFPGQMGNRPVITTSDATIQSGRSAEFLYILNYRESVESKELPMVQMMFMDEEGGYITIPPDAIRAESDLKETAPHLANILVNVDMSKVELEPGGNYKMMAYFGLPDGDALKTMTPVTVAMGNIAADGM